MARQNPAHDLKRAVDEHFDAAVGTHVRNVTGAAEIGGRVKDAAQRGWQSVKDWWNDDGRGNTRRRHGDIKLPGRRNNRRASGRR